MAIVKEKKEDQKNIALLSRGLLLGGRVTEKATLLALNSVYVFNISPQGTKSEIKKMINKIYKVKPQKINLINSPDKMIFQRGRLGKRAGSRKAFVYLKKGQKIEI